MSDGPDWFAPRRYGYGVGLPISWQGWALTICYILVATGLVLTLAKRPLELVFAIVFPTVAFIVISARTTRGGWRWRWGRED